MKKLLILFLLPITIYSCSSTSEEESGPTYEEKASKAIEEFTKSKDVKSVKMSNEVSLEDAKKSLIKYDSAIVLYEGAIENCNSSIESYKLAKESMSKIDNTYAAYFGDVMNTNYDSLIQDLEVKIVENTKMKDEVAEISSQIKSMMDAHKDKSPFSIFNAVVDGAERKFVVSPNEDKVKVLFEMFN
jgi:hypothetical protein